MGSKWGPMGRKWMWKKWVVNEKKGEAGSGEGRRRMGRK